MGHDVTLVEQVAEALRPLQDRSADERIETLNEIKKLLREYSPLKEEPIDCVLWVPQETVRANDYNPNRVASPEMQLLRTSIEEDGYTQPIVTFYDGESFEVVDGFHRNRIGREVELVRHRVRNRLPVTVINESRADKADRMASTIRHNRARGKHGVDAMSAIVVDLARRNWSDAKIAKEVGLDPDEVLRLKQISGLASLFFDREFSEAWEGEP